MCLFSDRILLSIDSASICFYTTNASGVQVNLVVTMPYHKDIVTKYNINNGSIISASLADALYTDLNKITKEQVLRDVGLTDDEVITLAKIGSRLTNNASVLALDVPSTSPESNKLQALLLIELPKIAQHLYQNKLDRSSDAYVSIMYDDTDTTPYIHYGSRSAENDE